MFFAPLSTAMAPGTEEIQRKSSLFSSLRARLFLLVALAVVPVLGLTFYTAIEQRQLAAVGVQETALQLAQITSSQQGQMIVGTRHLLIGLAQLREVRRGDPAACSAHFADLLKAYPHYSNLGAIDRNGDLYCSALPVAQQINVADRPYFQLAIRTSDFAIGDYQVGRVTKTATINFGYPIHDNTRNIQGVVFAALSLEWLNQVIKDAKLPEGSTFSITDRNGTILVRYPHPEKWVGKNIPELMPDNLGRGFLTGVAEASEPDGVPRLIGFTSLLGRREAGDVYLSVGIPKQLAYAEADRILARNLTWLAFIAVVAFAAAWYGGDLFILRQVNALVDTAKQLEEGNLTKRIGPPYGLGELGRLARTFDEMTVSLQKNAAQLGYQATHDLLTGLANRNFFRTHLESAILTANNQGLALLLMDVDRFKEINDTLGHHNGDLLLQRTTQRLKSIVGKTGIVGRLGGDEFAVFLPAADFAGAVLSAQQIVKAFEEPFLVKELPIAVEVSVGIALYPEHGDAADLLMRRAEVAMYAAKEERTGYAVYDPDRDRYSPERVTLIAELRQAMEEDQLYLLYQPKIDFQSRTVSGVEALIRWQHPRLGMLPPDQFIGLAERTGLIKPLTFWVLNQALRMCNVWQQRGLKLTVAINISSRNLEPDLPERISAVLESYKMPPQSLELEITEGMIMKDPVRAREILRRLSEMEIKISIDDFGTGYSSLSYLSKLPVDQVKIDKSFVINMATDQSASAIVQSTINLAHDLGLKVVAEGVENEATLVRLKSLRCDSAQGYYISRPIPGSELAKWLRVNSYWDAQLAPPAGGVSKKVQSEKATRTFS